MKPSFYDEYGRAVDKPVNAVAYELTEGGDLVRGKPHTWAALASHVFQHLQRYRDTQHIRSQQVEEDLKVWLEVNEGKKG